MKRFRNYSAVSCSTIFLIRENRSNPFDSASLTTLRCDCKIHKCDLQQGGLSQYRIVRLYCDMGAITCFITIKPLSKHIFAIVLGCFLEITMEKR